MNNLDKREAMKFIINGKSFDTATSSQVAISRGAVSPGDLSYSDYPGAEQVRFEDILFRTAKGNFFVHEHRTVKYPKGKPVVIDEAFERNPDEAMVWISNNNAAIVDSTGLALPEDA